MLPILERALSLWSQPVPDDDGEALARFRLVYADPVDVNGATTPLIELVHRARALQAAFDGLHHEVDREVDGGDHVAFTFRIGGRHLGPLETPLGTVPPTGRRLEVRGMDVFELCFGRVHALWAVSDQLGLLQQAGAVALSPRRC